MADLVRIILFQDSVLVEVSLINGIICTILASAKFFLGIKLESITLITDGMFA